MVSSPTVSASPHPLIGAAGSSMFSTRCELRPQRNARVLVYVRERYAASV